jgi:hypothetical protein
LSYVNAENPACALISQAASSWPQQLQINSGRVLNDQLG